MKQNVLLFYELIDSLPEYFEYFIMFIMFCCLLIFFSKLGFSKETSFRHITRVSNIFYPDQVRCFVGSDLGQKCLLKGYQQMTLVGFVRTIQVKGS